MSIQLWCSATLILLISSITPCSIVYVKPQTQTHKLPVRVPVVYYELEFNSIYIYSTDYLLMKAL